MAHWVFLLVPGIMKKQEPEMSVTYRLSTTNDLLSSLTICSQEEKVSLDAGLK